MYKDFLADMDLGRYKDRTSLFLENCKRDLKYFCRNLIITWTAVIECLADDIRNGRDTKEKMECVKHIQNTIWAMYKDFLADHDMAAYNRKMGELTKEYYDKGNKQLLSFCQNILISWSPIINAFKEEFKSGNV